MYYYKARDNGFFVTTAPLEGEIEVTEQEYLDALKAMEPTEEEIRAQKEAQLHALLRELYPEEYAEEGNNEHTTSQE